MLLQKLAASEWGNVSYVDATLLSKQSGQAAAHIGKLFEEARNWSRGIVIFDQLDLLAPRQDSFDRQWSNAAALRIGLNLLATEFPRKRILVIAATNQINQIDPSLRRPDCFEFEIEIPIPNAVARTEIIKSIVGLSVSANDSLLEQLGERSHGFTGSDLTALLRLAGWESVHRQGHSFGKLHYTSQVNGINTENIGDKASIHQLTQSDLDKALLQVRPTALREIVLEVPKVHWNDIGGQKHVKESLKEAFEWQFKVFINDFCRFSTLMVSAEPLAHAAARYPAEERPPIVRPTRMLQDINCQSPGNGVWLKLSCRQGRRASEHVRRRIRTSFARNLFQSQSSQSKHHLL